MLDCGVTQQVSGNVIGESSYKYALLSPCAQCHPKGAGRGVPQCQRIAPKQQQDLVDRISSDLARLFRKWQRQGASPEFIREHVAASMAQDPGLAEPVADD